MLTRREAAARAGVNIRTIDRWIRERKLTGYRAPGTRPVMIDAEELTELTTLRPIYMG